jgi:membrane glycosyltransferase
MNRALYIKLIWKIINSEGIWADHMHHKYIGQKSFWEIAQRDDDSGVWKYILKNRKIALKCLSLNIADGKTTSLWFDPWLNGCSIMERIG